MIKQSEITVINVDDFIRERKRSGAKYIRWTSKTAFEALQEFWKANLPCSHGWFCLCGNGERNLIKKDNGMTFMGIKHYFYGQNS